MGLSHDPKKMHASFDDPDLVSRAGPVPVIALAEKAGLADLVSEHVSVGGPCGVNADLKVACLVAGMAAGADSIDDLDVLRHGAMGELFGVIRAPSTLGSTPPLRGVLGAIRRAGACFSVTVPLRRDVRAAIEAIPEDA